MSLYFSNNLRTFKLDKDELSRFDIEDISAETIDKDFARNAKIHQCFRIKEKKLASTKLGVAAGA